MLRKISFFICLIIASTTQAQNKSLPASKPKLVVGIVVDQMRADYISKYRNKLGTGGFKKLAAQGYQCRNTHYNYVPTYTGPGHASIYTGTTPAVHGIVANDWFDRTENDTVYCAEDKNVKGVGSDNYAGKMSPKRLLSTTITDELQLTNQGKSKVIGISLKDRGAILPAGRSGDAAYWYDGSTGNWISSTWYMNDLPKWVKDFNERKWPDHYLSKPWTTTLPLSYYTESDPDDSPYELPYTGEAKPVFPHDLPALRGTSFDLVRRTPFGNTMTKDLAIAAISGEELGADSISDFLCVSFSATDYVGHQFGTDAVELEDTYIRLDRDIADLLQYLDSRIGKGNYLIFLTADHGAVVNPQSLIDKKLEAGFSDPKVISDTVKYFLQRKYGSSEYMQCYLNDQFYLNRSKVDSAKINICVMQQEIADFIRYKIDGLQDVLTNCNISTTEYNEPFRNKIQKGMQPKRSGDVVLLFSPGWTDKLFGNGKQGTTHGSPYPYDTHVPLMWYGWGIPAGACTRSINIPDIAPTLSFLLNIGIPNGCTGKVIEEIAK
jgi:predicted AlkP superfamily pyrophosphatase or phosphodiesterase